MSEKVIGLTPKQFRAVECLLSEPTARDASRAARIGEATLRRWKGDPLFQQAYREARNRAFGDALMTLEASTQKAVEILRRVIADESLTLLERVPAARVLIDYGLRSREQIEIEARLSQLEEQLTPKTI